MRLYTVTIDTDDLEPTDDPMFTLPIKEKKSIRDQIRKDMFNRLENGHVTTWQEFTSDSDFIELRKNVDPHFEKQFGEAYKSYIRGDWKTAGDHLKQLIKQRPHDGPTRNLHKWVVERANCVVPGDWKGFRELTSK